MSLQPIEKLELEFIIEKRYGEIVREEWKPATDIAMTDIDGYELFLRIKDHNPGIPVIMMTGFGYDPNHVLVRAKSDGLQEILYKPFELDKLIEVIDKHLKPNKKN